MFEAVAVKNGSNFLPIHAEIEEVSNFIPIHADTDEESKNVPPPPPVNSALVHKSLGTVES